MRIKQIRVYQAIQFEQHNYSYFTAREFQQAGVGSKLRDLDITLLPSGYVRVVSDKDVVDIGPGNVACIQYAREDYEAPKATKATKGA